MEEQPKEELVKPLVTEKPVALPPKTLLIGAIFVILAGVATGFIFSKNRIAIPLAGNNKPAIIKTAKTAGSTDTKAFPDVAEGTLEKGGIDGEGTDKLIRPGGESQTVYLTSSVINLDDFAGKKVRIWGQTFAAQKAGWLMDVGRVEVLE